MCYRPSLNWKFWIFPSAGLNLIVWLGYLTLRIRGHIHYPLHFSNRNLSWPANLEVHMLVLGLAWWQWYDWVLCQRRVEIISWVAGSVVKSCGHSGWHCLAGKGRASRSGGRSPQYGEEVEPTLTSFALNSWSGVAEWWPLYVCWYQPLWLWGLHRQSPLIYLIVLYEADLKERLSLAVRPDTQGSPRALGWSEGLNICKHHYLLVPAAMLWNRERN